MIQTRAEGVELLRRRIKESGMKTGRFAVEILIRQPRTVRRWVADDSPIPRIVLEYLEVGGPAKSSLGELRDRMQETGVCDVCGADT